MIKLTNILDDSDSNRALFVDFEEHDSPKYEHQNIIREHRHAYGLNIIYQYLSINQLSLSSDNYFGFHFLFLYLHRLA